MGRFLALAFVADGAALLSELPAAWGNVRLFDQAAFFHVFYDEMHELGLLVGLSVVDSTWVIEVATSTPRRPNHSSDTIAMARMSRYSVRALDRAARQIQAQLEVQDYLDPYSRYPVAKPASGASGNVCCVDDGA